MDIWILIISVLILILMLIIWIATVPIQIAKGRGITGNELATISILSWVSLVIGITWFIALALALSYQPQKWVDPNDQHTSLDLDALEKLGRLKKSGVLTIAEYNREKKKILGQ